MRILTVFVLVAVLLAGCNKNSDEKATVAAAPEGNSGSQVEECMSKLKVIQQEAEECEGKLTETEGKLTEAESGRTKAQMELDSLRPDLESCKAKVEQLSQTDQFYYEKVVGLLNEANYEEAAQTLVVLEQKFPQSELVGIAKEKLVEKRLGEISGGLSVSDKSTYSRALSELQSLEKLGAGNESIAALRTTVEKKLAEWPTVINTLKEVEVSYADLKGKMFVVSNVIYEADDYYNFMFMDEDRWRSFRIKKGRDSVHGYCIRGNDACDKSFKLVVAGARVAKEMTLTYPDTGNGSGGHVVIVDIQQSTE